MTDDECWDRRLWSYCPGLHSYLDFTAAHTVKAGMQQMTQGPLCLHAAQVKGGTKQTAGKLEIKRFGTGLDLI